jgi:cob(I)alamin adenosyltransferase
MRLYTRTGDDGTTGLFGGGRVSKDHPRVAAYGEVDALNAALGLAAVRCDDQVLIRTISALQHGCFALGADLATPPGTAHEDKVQRIGAPDVTELEAAIDAIDSGNEPLKVFILPGGCELAARLHIARSEARRCERAMVTLARDEAGGVSEAAMRWINRCSDLLFAMARKANQAADVPDTPWQGS